MQDLAKALFTPLNSGGSVMVCGELDRDPFVETSSKRTGTGPSTGGVLCGICGAGFFCGSPLHDAEDSFGLRGGDPLALRSAIGSAFLATYPCA